MTTNRHTLFNKSSFNAPVSAKQVKDLIAPLVSKMFQGKISDEDGENRVFVALPGKVIAILEYKDVTEYTFAQPIKTSEIRSHWGDVSAAIRINNIPFSIQELGSEKKVLFYRAPDTVGYADTWVDNYFEKKYKKNDNEKYERDIANLVKAVKTIGNCVKKIENKIDVLEKGTKEKTHNTNIMLHFLKEETQDIKIMLQQLDGIIPEKIYVVSVTDVYTSCVVALNIGLKFRMVRLPNPNQNLWGICSSNDYPINGNAHSSHISGHAYSSPNDLGHNEIKKILISLYDCDDRLLSNCLKENPDIKKYIEALKIFQRRALEIKLAINKEDE